MVIFGWFRKFNISTWHLFEFDRKYILINIYFFHKETQTNENEGVNSVPDGFTIWIWNNIDVKLYNMVFFFWNLLSVNVRTAWVELWWWALLMECSGSLYKRKNVQAHVCGKVWRIFKRSSHHHGVYVFYAWAAMGKKCECRGIYSDYLWDLFWKLYR